MSATLPGVSTTLNDTYSALSVTTDTLAHRVVIIGRTGSDANVTYAHEYEPKRYVSLADVATVHGTTDSELYEAFYHAQFAGCDDIWLCPLPAAHAADRTTQLATAYETLSSIRPTIVVPYGRGAKISIDANGVITRTVPTFGASPGIVDGAYADSAYDYLEDLAEVCATITDEERLCIGILGVEAMSGTGSGGAVAPSDLVTKIGTEQAPGTLLTDIPDAEDFAIENQEYGRFVSVVIGEVETAGMGPWAWRRGATTTYYRSNGALNYAGLISRLQLPDAPTNKVLSGISSLGFRLSKNQTLAAIAKKAVTFGAVNGVVRVDDAMTYAKAGSDFDRLSTVLICGAVDEMVRNTGRKFIGRGMSVYTRDSFITAIGSGLDGMITQQALLQADFSVRFDVPNHTAYVDVVVVPAWELRRIAFTISVRFQGLNSNAQ